MKIQLPIQVKNIINTLQQAGFEAYAVGGCVRDSILNRTPEDWDITTSALPEQVKLLFKRTVDTGIEHGTVTVMFDKEGFEVTTYRIDGEYTDNRHPKEVTFTPNLLEDLKRRDFTINAMAYNEDSGLIDAFDGLADIDHKIIRCVGDPKERFGEDALRIMRAVRFSAQLGYRIENKTWDAVGELAPTLSKISPERIRVELVKLVTSQNPYYLKKAYECGITKVIFPELDAMMKTEQNNKYHQYSVGEHVLHAMEAIAPDPILRLTMLLHDSGKATTGSKDENGVDHFYNHHIASEKIALDFLKRLRFDNDTIRKVTKLVLVHDHQMEPEPQSVRQALREVGEELFPMLLLVKRADISAKSEFRRDYKFNKVDKIEAIYKQILENKECFSLKTLQINGADLIGLGLKPGIKMGEILEKLLDLVIENPAQNNKEFLLEKATQLVREIFI